ncbi:MAG: serine hydrolase domain-containing protein [Verrucomicrobiota bacterium]
MVSAAKHLALCVTAILLLGYHSSRADDFDISWEGQTGGIYEVQDSEGLSSWNAVAAVSDDSHQFSVAIPAARNRYWRVNWQNWLLQTTKPIAQAYADWVTDSGLAPGIAVGITWNGERAFYTAGSKDQAGNPFDESTLFQVGSVTKVLTTAVFGCKVMSGDLSLIQPVLAYSQIVPGLSPLMQDLTLFQLATMTGGLPSDPPICPGSNPPPGCLPPGNERPNLTEYSPTDLMAFLGNAVPTNFNTDPHKTTSLPAPYFYSDTSIGILGLLLPYMTNQPFSSNPVGDWWTLVQDEVLTPLGMTDTQLSPLDGQLLPGAAEGFALALPIPVICPGLCTINGQPVTNGIASLVPDLLGARYDPSSPPVGTITGAGGSGAQFQTIVSGGSAIHSYNVISPGSGYDPPVLTFSGGSPTQQAEATVHVDQNGVIERVLILAPGKGYSSEPSLSLTGGGGTGFAAGPIRFGQGKIIEVAIASGGTNYNPPLKISIPPPNPFENNVPAWAAAGAASSSIRDILSFLEACLGHTEVNGNPVPQNLTLGLQLAMSPFVPTPTGEFFSGFAWEYFPATTSPPFAPPLIAKSGGISGFSTQIYVVPELDLGLAVFVNARGDGETGPTSDLLDTKLAPSIARAIINVLSLSNSLTEFSNSITFDTIPSP